MFKVSWNKMKIPTKKGFVTCRAAACSPYVEIQQTLNHDPFPIIHELQQEPRVAVVQKDTFRAPQADPTPAL